MSYRLRLARVNSFKLKTPTRIPAQLVGGDGIEIERENGVYTFDLDFSELQEQLAVASDLEATTFIPLWESIGDDFSRISLENLKADIEDTFDGLYQPLDDTLTALAALDSTAGLLTQTGADTFVRRSLAAPAAGFTITNPAGTAGNPTFVLANDLAALEALSNGIPARTAADTWTPRTMTGTANQITVTNGDGVAGNPTFSIPSNAALPGAPTTTTASASDNSTKIATTAYVDAAVAAAGVSTLNGQTGALEAYFQPQGRLTLTSATPVLTGTVSGATTVYYTPYVGNMVPLYDGTNMVPTVVAEVSQATTDTTKSPAAVANNSVYDLFVWNDGGTIRCTRGPAWTNDTTRSAGTALVMVKGILLNNASITNGPAASRGTYVGTIRSNGSAAIDYIFGAVALNGTAGFFGLWNAYNRVDVATFLGDTTDTWTYSVANTWRAPNGNATMRVTMVRGLNEDAITASYQAMGASGAASAIASGVGVDSTTAFSGTTGFSNQTFALQFSGVYSGLPGLGVHFVSAIELNGTTTAGTFYGDAGVAYLQTGLHVKMRL